MNYIIGGGITGLILLELNKDYKLITDQIGGQLKMEVPTGPKILHHSTKVAQFLKSVGLNSFSYLKTFKVGYLVNDKIIDNLSKNDALFYYQKTRGRSSIPNSTFLSEGKTMIAGYDMNELGLVNLLYERNKDRIIHKKVNFIDTDYKTLNGILQYDKLISTIDLQLLLKLLIIPVNLEKNLVHYYLVEKTKKDIFDVNPILSYVYDIYNLDINRITKVDENKRIIESNNYTKFDGYKVIKHIPLYTQLRYELKLKEIRGIKLVGRFAEYNHAVKANNIIEEYFNERKNMYI